MINILHFIWGLGIGGAETFISNMLNSMPHSEYHFDFAIQNPNITNENISKYIREHNSTVYVLPKFTRSIIKQYRILGKLLAYNKYDFVHVHMNALINPLPLICAHQTHTKLVLHSHNSQSNVGGMVGKLIHTTNRSMFLGKNDRRIACSDKAGKWMFGNRNFSVIPNAIEIDKFNFSKSSRNEIRGKFGIRDTETLLGSIARFVPAKNHRRMIDIFADYLHRINPESRLMLVGDGPLLEDTKKYVRQIGLTDRVIFTGATARPHGHYCALDMFIMPSLFEGLAFTAIEAQASGLPCILSDTISHEIDPLNRLRFISLKAPTSSWSDAISKDLGIARNRDRYIYGAQMAHTIYNVKHLFEIMRGIYLQ